MSRAADVRPTKKEVVEKPENHQSPKEEALLKMASDFFSEAEKTFAALKKENTELRRELEQLKELAKQTQQSVQPSYEGRLMAASAICARLLKLFEPVEPEPEGCWTCGGDRWVVDYSDKLVRCPDCRGEE